jgi:hypothetical protein
MKRFLNWFRRDLLSKPASANRTCRFRPQLEQLDDRVLLSLSSAISILHTVSSHNQLYHWRERDWYTVDQATTQVVKFQDTSRQNLGGPNNVVAVSASIDPKTGFAELFAVATDDQTNLPYLWLCDSHGAWTRLSPSNVSGTYVYISASRDGHV